MEPSRADFGHPYEPYDIQIGFMSQLYRCIESGNVGIFESPTGTGKSLSLICGALTWLRDHKRIPPEPLHAHSTEGEDPDWMVTAERKEQQDIFLDRRRELEIRLAAIRKDDAEHKRSHLSSQRQTKKTRTSKNETRDMQVDAVDDFMLDDYESDKDSKSSLPPSNGLSSDTQALLSKLRGSSPAREEERALDELKIIFCSRTHSQLSQFVSELRRVRPLPSLPPSLVRETGDGDENYEAVKQLSLGSRKNLCINPQVLHLSSSTAMNERCLEIQKPGTPTAQKCKYLPSKDDRARVDSFRDRALARIGDIEDLAQLGRDRKVCPYYASRSAVAPAEIVTLPYPLLLQKSARESLGISVRDNIVVIDEAHNLMNAIADTFSIAISLAEVERATSQVTAYAQRFQTRLKGKNRVYVTQFIRLLRSISDCLRQSAEASGPAEFAVTPMQLMAGKGVDQIRPHKLIQYLQESKLAYKVEGYIEVTDKDSQSHRGLLLRFQSFLNVLMNPADEGRFFVSCEERNVLVKYSLLDPKEHFREIVEEARAVILAGGTMSPMSDYADYLFPYLPTHRLKTFTFGHVIPREHLSVQTVSKGPSGLDFDFTFEKRKSQTMMIDLGRAMERICSITPDGVVAFFPSYDYLNQVVNTWKQSKTTADIFSRLATHKRIFEESKDVSVDKLLREYAQCIDGGEGGLMLSVVGGKLSEGINFSDKLGRAVIAVGLPFPNANGAEWKAKIEHVEQMRLFRCKEGGLSETECRNRARAAGRDFFENACMRAINQCIGRAIRHKNDYAAIILMDKRYSTERISSKLPGWIRENMGPEVQESWKDVEKSLETFFADKPSS